MLGNTNKAFGTALATGYHHLVVNLKEKNGASTDVTLYNNGVQVGAVQNYAVALPNFSPQTWQLGARKSGASTYDQYFSGLIDGVAFYDTTLTPAQIQANLATGTHATNPRLRSWFPLNESRSATVEDIGPARTGKGTIQGALWSSVTGISSVFDHEFQPQERLLTLNPSNTSTDQVDFTDLAVPVSGYVRFDGTECFAKDVEILVNGLSTNPKTMTDSTGKFVMIFEPGASALLTPRLSNHIFAPASWSVQNLNAPVAGILFRDLTRRSIRGSVTGGLCKKGLLGPGHSLTVKVADPGSNPCFERTITLQGDADGGNQKLRIQRPPAAN